MAAPTDRTSPLGRSIRALREGLGWSRDTLGREAGIGESTIARVELYGDEPTLRVLTAVASALGTTAAALLAAEPEEC